METRAVVITGAPGAGKSSVLERLGTLLEIDGVAYGALESEQLSWGSPGLEHDAMCAQLAAVLQLQRAAGRRTFLVSATTETPDELAAVTAALGVDAVVTVLLAAPPDVVAARIEEREPDDWPGKRALVVHARELAGAMARLDVDVRVDTAARAVNDVAAEVHELLRGRGAYA